MTQQSLDVLTLRGHAVIGRDGERLGTIEEIYLDTDTSRVEWAVVTTGRFGAEQSFVPITGASRNGVGVTVPFDKAAVEDAPKVDPGGPMSEREEGELYRHYGMDYGGAPARTPRSGVRGRHDPE